MKPHLLKPSLADEFAAKPLYSVGTGVVVGAFGGPAAVLVLMMINARRMGRLAQDAWVFVLLGLGTGILIFALVNDPALFANPLGLEASNRLNRSVISIAGLLTMGLLYLRYRKHYRAMQMLAIDSPSPWKVGIGSLFAGWGLQWLLGVIALILLGMS